MSANANSLQTYLEINLIRKLNLSEEASQVGGSMKKESMQAHSAPGKQNLQKRSNEQAHTPKHPNPNPPTKNRTKAPNLPQTGTKPRLLVISALLMTLNQAIRVGSTPPPNKSATTVTNQFLFKGDSKEIKFTDLKFNRDITSNFNISISPPLSNKTNPTFLIKTFQPYSFLKNESHSLLSSTKGCDQSKSLDKFRMITICRDPKDADSEPSIIGTSFYKKESSIFLSKMIAGYNKTLVCGQKIFEKMIPEKHPEGKIIMISKQFIYCRRRGDLTSVSKGDLIARLIITERFFNPVDVVDITKGGWNFTKPNYVNMSRVGFTYIPQNITKMIFAGVDLPAENIIGMICFYFRRTYEGPIECGLLSLTVSVDGTTGKLKKSIKVIHQMLTEDNVKLLKDPHIQLLGIENLDNILRAGDLDLVLFKSVSKSEGIVFSQSAKFLFNNTTKKLNFVNITTPYQYSVTIDNNANDLHIVGHSQTTIYSIYRQSLISIIFNNPTPAQKGIATTQVRGLQYNFICSEFNEGFVIDNFNFGGRYMFTSYKAANGNGTRVFVVIDIFDNFQLGGQRCVRVDNASFVSYNRDSRVMYFKDGNLTSYELSEGSVVVQAKKKTDQVYTMTVSQYSDRQPNAHKTVKISVIEDPFTDFMIDVQPGNLDVLRGGWSELQVGRRTFLGNNGETHLEGIPSPSFIRIGIGATNQCPFVAGNITISPKNSSKGLDTLYTKPIKNMWLLRETTLLVTTRERYGIFICNNDQKISSARPCYCKEYYKAPLEPNQYILFASTIQFRFVLMTISDSLEVSASKLKVKDTKKTGSENDVLRYNNTNYVVLEKQKGTCLDYPSASTTRFIYIRESENSTKDANGATNDQIWTVVLNLTRNETLGAQFTISSHHRLKFLGDLESTKKMIFSIKRIQGSTNTFMFNYQNLENKQFGIAFATILVYNCPDQEEACLRVERKIQVWDFGNQLSEFDFCPMGNNVAIFNKKFKSSKSVIINKIQTTPLIKDSPETSGADIWFDYPFFSIKLEKILDIQCQGSMGVFQILVSTNDNKTRLVTYQALKNQDPRLRVLKIDEMDKKVNAFSTVSESSRGYLPLIAYSKTLDSTNETKGRTLRQSSNRIYVISVRQNVQFFTNIGQEDYQINLVLNTSSSRSALARASVGLRVVTQDPFDAPVIELTPSRAINLLDLVKSNFSGGVNFNLEQKPLPILNITGHYFKSALEVMDKNRGRYVPIDPKNSPIRLEDKVLHLKDIQVGKEFYTIMSKSRWVALLRRDGSVVLTKMTEDRDLDSTCQTIFDVGAKYAYLKRTRDKKVMLLFILIDKEDGDILEVISFFSNTTKFTNQTKFSKRRFSTKYTYYMLSATGCKDSDIFVIPIMNNLQNEQTLVTFRHNLKPGSLDLSQAEFISKDLTFYAQIIDYSGICVPDKLGKTRLFYQVLVHRLQRNITIFQLDTTSQRYIRNTQISLPDAHEKSFPLNIGFIKTGIWAGQDEILHVRSYVALSGVRDIIYNMHININKDKTIMVDGMTLNSSVPKVKSFQSINIKSFSNYILLEGFNIADESEYSANRRYHLLLFDIPQNRIIGSFSMSKQALQSIETLSISCAVDTDEEGRINIYTIMSERQGKFQLGSITSRIQVYLIQNLSFVLNRTKFLGLVPKNGSINQKENQSLGYNRSLREAIEGVFNPADYRLMSYSFDDSPTQNISFEILLGFSEEAVTLAEQHFVKILVYVIIAWAISVFILVSLCRCSQGVMKGVEEIFDEEEAYWSYRRMLRSKKRYGMTRKKKVYTTRL